MLSDVATEDLARSGITPEQAEAAGWSSIEDASLIAPSFRAAPALVIPYGDPDGALVLNADSSPFCRVRYLELPEVHSFVKVKPQRYAQAPGTRPHAFLSPATDWATIAPDPALPLIITEGEKKALAACAAGFPTIGLGGVDSWRYPGVDLLEELLRFAVRDRLIYICYDSDAAYNAGVRGAEARLAHYLLDRQARVAICRLPEGDSKVGLDDYLVGGGKISEVLHASEKMDSLTTEIAKLNSQIAWVEDEGQAYEPETGGFVRRDVLTNGSKFSALKIRGAKKTKTDAVKETEQSLARIWLTHTMTRRYQSVLFRPGMAAEFDVRGGRALNLWSGWRAAAGNVEPFLEFNEHLFSRLPPEARDLPLKMMIYKAQHPEIKIPIAIVLVGEQYAGKSLWGACMREAFSPYAVELSSAAFKSNFNGWIEKSLIATVNEAKGREIKEGWENLKALITDTDRPMEEKYRVARQIKTFTQYIFMANGHSIGSFDRGDRRMYVIDVPDPAGSADTGWQPHPVAVACSRWLNAGGGPALMDWMLGVDLGAWVPPDAAPLTDEKYMAHIEGRTPLQRIADELLDAAPGDNYLPRAFAAASAWQTELITSSNEVLAAHAIADAKWLKTARMRPFYTPTELTYIFPQIMEHLLSAKFAKTTTPGQISRELRDAGIPFLKCLDSRKGFVYRGLREQFLIVSDFAKYRPGITQAEFDRIMLEQVR